MPWGVSIEKPAFVGFKMNKLVFMNTLIYTLKVSTVEHHDLTIGGSLISHVI